MDTAKSLPLVEAPSVSVLSVDVDLDELHPTGPKEVGARFEEGGANALGTHRPHNAKLVKQRDGTVVPDIGSQGQKCQPSRRLASQHSNCIVTSKEAV